MSRGFKNARCGSGIPDAYGYGFLPPFELRCRRLTAHPDNHRVVFADGAVREWVTGDHVSVLREQPHD